MILCLDVGNSQIFGGVFEDGQLRLQFRRQSKDGASSDEVGLFLRSVLRENDISPDRVDQIALCTVVPEVLHSIRNACLKYFDRAPFILQAGAKTGLKIRYYNPTEVGSDRIANSIAATHLYPNQNLIIIDFGTATTFCAVTKDKDYLGGVITPGVRLSMQALESKTSKLPSVEIKKPTSALGRSPAESIQSGLYYGTVGAVKEIVSHLSHQCFNDEKPMVIGTGGFCGLFEKENLFDRVQTELVLQGLSLALQMNL